MTKGPKTTWLSVMLSPEEKDALNDHVAEVRKSDPKATRNSIVREAIRRIINR